MRIPQRSNFVDQPRLPVRAAKPEEPEIDYVEVMMRVTTVRLYSQVVELCGLFRFGLDRRQRSLTTYANSRMTCFGHDPTSARRTNKSDQDSCPP